MNFPSAGQPSAFRTRLGAIIGRQRADTTKPTREDQDEARGKRKTKKAAPDPNEDDVPEEEQPEAERAARARERRRCRAIVTSAPAHENPMAAVALAVTTDMPRGEAVAFLGRFNSAVAAGDAHQAAEARTAASGPNQASASAIVAAGRKARGEVTPAEPRSPLARDILAAGRRARGEA